MITAAAATVRAEAEIDAGALRDNAATLLGIVRRRSEAAELMAVVKADGYGHGDLVAAQAALAGGATVLGLATPGEATSLRARGITAPLVAWLWTPGEDVRPAVLAGVQITVSSAQHLEAVRVAGADIGAGPVPIHLKVDTGLGRGGVLPAELAALAGSAAAAERAGELVVVGLMSHFACADEPGDPSIDAQLAAFRRAEQQLSGLGVRPRWRHLANTPAVLTRPDTDFDLVRCGIGIYGFDPVVGGTAAGAALRPAMTLRARVALTKRVPAGYGVNYGLTYRTDRESTLALVPIGYADGIPRNAGNAAEVLLAGRRRRIAGRVAMDQFVVDCGDDPVAADDEVLVFGPGMRGEPTATDWARWCGTIDYEIVTRIGSRVPRRVVPLPSGGDADGGPGGGAALITRSAHESAEPTMRTRSR